LQQLPRADGEYTPEQRRGIDAQLDGAAEALSGAKWLGPFGVDIRYPGAAAGMLPGDEVKAIEIARLAKEVVLRILDEG